MRKFIFFAIVTVVLLFNIACAEEITKVHDTGHFTINVPAHWIQRDTDSDTYFYAEEYGSVKGGMLCVKETSNQPITSNHLQTMYDAYISGVAGSETTVGGLQSEYIEVDDDQAVYFEYSQMLNANQETVCGVYYIVDGYSIQLLYVNSASNTDKQELLALTEQLAYKFSKVPKSTILGKKCVSVIGYEVTNQNGYDCIIVEYRWWHNEDEPIAFSTSFSTEMYQNGIECQSWILTDRKAETMTKVQKGTYLTSYDIFILRDTVNPVTLYVDNIFDFGNTYKDLVIEFDITQ